MYYKEREKADTNYFTLSDGTLSHDISFFKESTVFIKQLVLITILRIY